MIREETQRGYTEEAKDDLIERNDDRSLMVLAATYIDEREYDLAQVYLDQIDVDSQGDIDFVNLLEFIIQNEGLYNLYFGGTSGKQEMEQLTTLSLFAQGGKDAAIIAENLLAIPNRKVPERFPQKLDKNLLGKNETNSLKIMPNPSTDYLYFSIHSNQQIKNRVYFIYDSTGQLVQTGQTNKEYIEVLNLPTGLFYLQIQDNNQIFSNKFVIQK